MIILTGKSVLPEIAIGKIKYFVASRALVIRREITDVHAEKARANEGIARAAAELESLCQKALEEAGEQSAALFDVHRMVLEDDDFLDCVLGLIDEEHVNAEFAVDEARKKFEQMFLSMRTQYMRERAADMLDICGLVIACLSGRTDFSLPLKEPFIALADDIAPSETVRMARQRLLGIVTRGGSVQSHTAILARSMNIPAVVGVDLFDPGYDGRMAIIDGCSGKVYIDPEPELLMEMEAKRASGLKRRDELRSLIGKEDITKDGISVELYANIGSPQDLDEVLKNDAKGIGLFRSEFLYLNNHTFPSEDEQFEAYREVLERMDGRRVVIRTLDIGADKQAGYFNLEKEENPALGLRALRLCLARPEIFKTQLRALYRASVSGRLAIMFPMITSIWEVREIKRICNEVQSELHGEGVKTAEKIEHGVMIETPAAVMIADQLSREVDFFSIGTNDLTQYTLAADRQNKNLDRFYDPKHKALLRMLKIAVEHAHRAGIWIGVCGELAADLDLTEFFLAIGIDELSVAPSSVLPLRHKLRSTAIAKKRGEIITDFLA